MPFEIVKEPYLEKLRAEVTELKRLVDGEPTELTITYAWASFDKIKAALSRLSPNRPEIWHNRP